MLDLNKIKSVDELTDYFKNTTCNMFLTNEEGALVIHNLREKAKGILGFAKTEVRHNLHPGTPCDVQHITFHLQLQSKVVTIFIENIDKGSKPLKNLI